MVDDDFYYHKDFVSWMIDAYRGSDKRTVFATWGCIVGMQDGEYLPYSQWKDCKYEDRNSEYSLYGGGSIYPPHIFDNEVSNKDVFMKLCPTADDIWFWAQEKRMGVKVCLTEKHGYGLHRLIDRISAYDVIGSGSLTAVNVLGQKNDEQLRAVLDYYQLE